MGEKIKVTIWNLPCVACGGTGEVEGTVEGRPAACAAPGCEGQGDVEESEHEFPARFEVCGDCEGEGTHLHPAIREHAYTSEEWSGEDDDFREEYMRGGRGIYGVQCETCGGRRVVPVVDERRLTPEQKKLFKLYEKQERQRDQDDYEDARTRRLESGGLY